MAGFESPTLMQENTVVTTIELVEGGNIIRQGHHLTIGYIAYDEVGEVVDLSGKDLTVSIWGRKGIAFEADAVFEDGVLRFTLDQALPSGDYNVEFTATLSTDTGYRKKYPTNANTGRISVKQSADDLGAVGISVFTIDKFEKKQKALQDEYHASVDSKVETLEAGFEQAVGAITVDSEVVLARGEASTLRARLDAEKNAVTAQLAETATKAELQQVSLSFKESFQTVVELQGAYPSGDSYNHVVLADGLIYTWNQLGSWVSTGIQANGTGIANGTITHKKMAFPVLQGTPSKNLFDKTNFTTDRYVNHTTGALDIVSTMVVSDFIRIQPSATYRKTNSLQHAFYDANRVFISGANAVNTFTTPANAVYVRVTVRKTELDTYQLELGSVATKYESFPPKLDNELIRPKTIEKQMLDFDIPELEASKNLFNKATVTIDAYIAFSTGVLTPGSTNFVASDYIPIVGNTAYTKVDNSQFAFYDSNLVYISGVDVGTTFTTPANAAFMRTTIRKVNVDIEQIELGTVSTGYVANGNFIKDRYLPTSISSILDNNSVDIDIQLPDNIYLVSGESFHLYYNNVIKYSQAVRKGNYYVAHRLIGANTFTRKGIGYDYKWEYTPTTAETFQMEFMVFETYTGKKIASKTVTFTAKDSSLVANHGRTANIVTIGDSFLDLYKVSTFFYTNMQTKGGGNIPNMIGTRPIQWTEPPAADDAMAGWTYDWYVNLQSFGANTNPFFNPATSKFDFSYYMAQRFPAYTPAGQAGESVDAFVNMLGLNDAIWEGFNETTARANVQFIIDSVRAYDPAIKIILNTVTPQPVGDDFLPNTNNYLNGGNYEKSKWNQEQWNEMILSFHNPTNEIWVLPSAAHFDSRNGLISASKNTDKFTTGFTEVIETDIHPNDSGAKWIADSMYQAVYNLVLR